MKSPRRRRLAATALALLATRLAGTSRAAPGACEEAAAWPLWQAFVARFVQPDGRVIDDQHASRYTTSEGQAYALFFALVANERERFDTLLRWTDRQLAAGQLASRLPGWRWGRRDDGVWTLIDANSAADADLWLSYTLFEAARLWSVPSYRRLAHALLDRVEAEEVVRLPGLGAMLLPAPFGFHLGPGHWRLNPSYLAPHQLRYFAALRPRGPWADIARQALAMLAAVAPLGYAPDWVEYSEARGWHASPLSPAEGSYDAIRTYLWAGLLHPDDPDRAALLRTLRGMHAALASDAARPPQRVRTDSGARSGDAPAGFSAALLPYLQAAGATRLVEQQLARVRAASVVAPGCQASRHATGLVGVPPTYYDQVLTLFGQGAIEGRFRFDRHGALQPAWRGAARS